MFGLRCISTILTNTSACDFGARDERIGQYCVGYLFLRNSHRFLCGWEHALWTRILRKSFEYRLAKVCLCLLRQNMGGQLRLILQVWSWLRYREDHCGNLCIYLLGGWLFACPPLHHGDWMEQSRSGKEGCGHRVDVCWQRRSAIKS